MPSLMSLRVMLSSLLIGTTALAADPPPSGAPPGPAPPPVASAPATPATGTIIQGTVILKRKSPVVGAAVVVRSQDGGSSVVVTSTDAKGNFRVDSVQDGSYRLDVTREGYEPVVKDNVAVKAPFRAVVEIVMEAAKGGATAPAATPKDGASTGPIRLTGVASTRDSGPKGEVEIRMQRADGKDEPRSTLSMQDGSFAIDGLTPGAWRLELLGAGYLPIRVALDLEEDSRMTATLVPQPMNYTPAPEDLLPPEEPIPPKDPAAPK
jgi:hypothetical protein